MHRLPTTPLGFVPLNLAIADLKNWFLGVSNQPKTKQKKQTN